MDSFESQPSSPLITGTNDNKTTTTRTCNNCIRQKGIHYSLLIFVTVVVLLAATGVTLTLATLSNLPRGSVVLGTTNVALLLTLKPSDVDQVTFIETEDNIAALLYDIECSDIETERYLLDYTKSLDVTEQQYRIDEFYLVKNSTIHYLFTTPETQNSSSCVAMVHIFSDHSNYLQFISTGLVLEAVFSYCLSPALPLNFTISVSAAEEDQYYFVGLESSANTTINSTASGDLLKYNITTLSPTTCTFPTTNCSISLSGGEDMCILAQLQDVNKFISLNYTTQSQRAYIQSITGIVLIGSGPFIIIAPCISYIILCFLECHER